MMLLESVVALLGDSSSSTTPQASLDDSIKEVKLMLDNMAERNDGAPKEAQEKQFEAKPGMEADVKVFEAEIATGKIDPRLAVGQRFRGFMKANPDSEEARAYDALSGTPGSTTAKAMLPRNINKNKENGKTNQKHRTKKANFRMLWAKNQLEQKVTLKRSHLQQLEELVGERGEYLAFDRIIEREGGLANEAVVRRAVNYTCEAIKRGRPYLEYNDWKRCTEVLYFTKVRPKKEHL